MDFRTFGHSDIRTLRHPDNLIPENQIVIISERLNI